MSNPFQNRGPEQSRTGSTVRVHDSDQLEEEYAR